MKEIALDKLGTLLGKKAFAEAENELWEFVDSRFGTAAETVELNYRYESDDEGGTYSSIESLTVMDAVGNFLYIQVPDSYKEQYLKDNPELEEPLSEEDLVEIQDAYMEDEYSLD